MRFNENKMLRHHNVQKNELIKMPIFDFWKIIKK